MADLDFTVGSSNLVLDVNETTSGFATGLESDAYFQQAFTNQSSVTVTHNLNKYPAVQIIDSAGDQVEGNVSHDSLNELTVTFSSSFTGTIFCN